MSIDVGSMRRLTECIHIIIILSNKCVFTRARMINECDATHRVFYGNLIGMANDGMAQHKCVYLPTTSR